MLEGILQIDLCYFPIAGSIILKNYYVLEGTHILRAGSQEHFDPSHVLNQGFFFSMIGRKQVLHNSERQGHLLCQVLRGQDRHQVHQVQEYPHQRRRHLPVSS
jgi:hypothetical protein